MKKILSLLLIFVLAFAMTACGGDDDKDDDKDPVCSTGQVLEDGKCVDEGPTDQELADAALAALEFDVTEALLDFDLPVVGADGVFFAWYSNSSAIAVNTDGDKALVTRPAAGMEDATVTLTVVAEKGVASAEKDFTVVVPAIPGGVAEKLAEAKKSLRFDDILDLSKVTETSFLLPNTSPLYDEIVIEWEIVAFADLPNVPTDPGMPTGYVGVDEDGRDAYIETVGEYSYCMVDATDDLSGNSDTLDATHDKKDTEFLSYKDSTNIFPNGVAEKACGWSAYGANGDGGQAFLVEHGVWDMYPVYQNDPVNGERNETALEPVFAYDQYLIDAAYFLAYDETVLATSEVAAGTQVTVTRPASGNVNVRIIATLSWDDADVTVDPTDKEFEFVFVEAPQDDETKLAEAVAAFKVFGISFVDGDFELPLSGLYDATVVWSSNNENLISVAADGKATVASPLKNTAVTLTATITVGTKTETKAFVAVVVGTEATYTYRSSISPTTNINPHNETLSNASTLYGWITGGLYTGDIDWAASIAAGAAQSEGDFTNTAALVYDRLPYLAAGMPVDVSPVDAPETVWQITLRDDLEFEDGTVINADTMIYTYKMLLDPRLANARAGGVYSDIKIVGAEAYAKQALPVDFGVNDAYPVSFDTVGIKKVDDLTIEFTLANGMTDWDLRGNLMSGIMGPVHEGLYEAGMNETRTITNYGSAVDKIMSYGPFNLVTWEPGVVFIYERNDDHFDAESYRMTHIRYEVIQSQSIIVNEFKAGRLDVAGVGGVYYPEYKNNPNVVLTPATTTFRWATNIGERGDEQTNPMMAYKEFRQAIYHAVNRQEMVSSVSAPALANQAFLSPEYIISDTSSVSYRASQQGNDVLANLYPETAGYNPDAALALFNAAYAKAETDGVLPADGKVWVELAMLDAETNWITNNWVKDVVTASFDAQPGGTNEGKFEFKIAAYTTDALDVAEANANFDLMFYAWTGVKFNPIALMGWVWNENFAYMNEKGWTPGVWAITAEIPEYYDSLETPLVEPAEVTMPTYFDPAAPTEQELADMAAYEAYVLEKAFYDGQQDANNAVTITYNDWFNAVMSGGRLYAKYDGRDNDLLNIAAAMEAELLENVIGIPLFTSVGTAVYSDRVVIEFNEYHAWMGWGGLKYMYLNAPDPVN